jgi:3-oxoadipate enol-lactonase
MSEQIIEIASGRIRCSIQGSGPPVCLLATLQGSWAAEARGLRDKYTVLTYDMRGFGDSTSLTAGLPSNPELAEDLALMLEALGWKKISLIGLSHGGAVAQYFAGAFGEKLQSLVIVSSFARASGSTSILLTMLNGFLERGDMAGFWEVLKAFLCSERNRSYLLRMERPLKKLMFDQYTRESLAHIYRGALLQDTTGLLGKISVPTLVVGGEEDMLFPPRITAEITAAIPGAVECLLPTAHVPPIEEPQLFHSRLTSFLESTW